MSAIFFIANILLGATILYYLSSYIFENNLGDSSFAGLSTAVKSVVGILIGIAYGFIVKKLGRWTSTVSYAVAGVTLLLLIWFPGQAMALVIGTVCGLTYKVLMSYNYGHGFSIVPASRADDVSSITTAVYGLGSFLCTYFATWLMQMMHTDLVTPTWYVAAIGFIIITVIDIFVALREKKSFGV